MRRRDERGNAALVFVVAALFWLIVGCTKFVGWVSESNADSEQWCRDTEAFWANGNEYDSGLDDEYAMQCG